MLSAMENAGKGLFEERPVRREITWSREKCVLTASPVFYFFSEGIFFDGSRITEAALISTPGEGLIPGQWRRIFPIRLK